MTEAAAERERLQIICKVEWPTMALAGLIYGAWMAATFWHAFLPWPLRIACGGWIVAWQSSLQHEAIHEHPTRSVRLNALVAAWPLSLWLPYRLYRESHLAHHATEGLTTPGYDPETHYRAAPVGRLARLDHALARATSTLLGRLTLGPALLMLRFLAREAASPWTPERARVWAEHAGLAALVLAWITLVCRMTLVEYWLAFVYPGASLTLLRSFAEHRAHVDKRRRAALVERAPVLGLLFLHNNLHALHHERPALPWYRLPASYREHRARLLQENGGLAYDGYREVFRRYLLRPHDRLLHPGPAEPHP